MKKVSLVLLIFLVLLAGCFNDVEEKEKQGVENLRKSGSFWIVSKFPEANQTGIDVGERIMVEFSSDIDDSTVNSNTIRLKDNVTGEYLNGEVVVSGKKLIFYPDTKFVAANNATEAKCMKPDRSYQIYLNSVTGENGTSITPKNWSFRTADLNYGLYWMDKNGNSEKYFAGRDNRYYDSSKPVILYAHGWQNGTSENNYWMDQPFILKDKYTDVNTAKMWKAKGYNIGFFVWTQFADEGEVKDAEAKIWKGRNYRKDMRYKMADGSYRNFSTSKSVHELLYDVYKIALADNTSGNIRFAGHSLGNQVVTAIAGKIVDEYENGRVNISLIPNRIALLDSFWSKNWKRYLGYRWNGEVCREKINKLIRDYGVVVEQNKTTAIGGAITGDENLDMRRMTAFSRIWPNFIPITDAAMQHTYACYWYFYSVGYNIDTDYGYIGAGISDNQVRSMMNYYNSNDFYMDSSGSGEWTSTPADDSFVKTSGVSTW